MNRRDALKATILLMLPARLRAASAVSTLIGTGAAGHSDAQVNNPYGLAIGPDGALYFCDLDNQRIRRLDLKTRRTTDVAGNGQRGYSGDGGPATAASLNMPHELAFDARGDIYVAERDNHVVRKIDRRTGTISTFAGTGEAGFSGDLGPASKARLRQPHSIVVMNNLLLICDIGNHRIRAINLGIGKITTVGGTGDRAPTRNGEPLTGNPLNGPRTMTIASDGDMFLALREGNAVYRINPRGSVLHHIAGTGEQGYSGDGGPAREARLSGPKGLAADGRHLYIADTESHTIRRVDLGTGIITTVLGTGERGDGPETDPRQCKLARPHGLFADGHGTVYVSDSEAHRIRVLTNLD